MKRLAGHSDRIAIFAMWLGTRRVPANYAGVLNITPREKNTRSARVTSSPDQVRETRKLTIGISVAVLLLLPTCFGRLPDHRSRTLILRRAARPGWHSHDGRELPLASSWLASLLHASMHFYFPCLESTSARALWKWNLPPSCEAAGCV